MVARRTLRSGYTTGACAAAAAKGATLLLLGEAPHEVALRLPWNARDAQDVRFSLVDPRVDRGVGVCGVVKDAGDDPDVTGGVEVRAAVSWEGSASGPKDPVSVAIDGGEGVGRVTKPGLAVSPGQAAINPVPRAMIEAAVRAALTTTGHRRGRSLQVRITVPRGEEVARKTLNARLGILGGISILGTTGIVLPMSADAWRATIDSCLDVARAAGLSTVVLSHGRSSEAAARLLLPDLAPEAFVLMGDHVGYALDAAAARRLRVILAGQFAKFCKVAAGHFETHVKDSSLDLGNLARLAEDEGAEDGGRLVLGANTARQVYERLQLTGDQTVFRALAREVGLRASGRIRGRVPVEAVLFGYSKECLARSSVPSSPSPRAPRVPG